MIYFRRGADECHRVLCASKSVGILLRKRNKIKKKDERDRVKRESDNLNSLYTWQQNLWGRGCGGGGRGCVKDCIIYGATSQSESRPNPSIPVSNNNDCQPKTTPQRRLRNISLLPPPPTTKQKNKKTKKKLLPFLPPYK